MNTESHLPSENAKKLMEEVLREQMKKQQVGTDEKMVVALRITIARKEAGLSQKELAERLHVTAIQVSRWEAAIYIPDMIEFRKLCEITGKPFEYFYKPL